MRFKCSMFSSFIKCSLFSSYIKCSLFSSYIKCSLFSSYINMVQVFTVQFLYKVFTVQFLYKYGSMWAVTTVFLFDCLPRDRKRNFEWPHIHNAPFNPSILRTDHLKSALKAIKPGFTLAHCVNSALHDVTFIPGKSRIFIVKRSFKKFECECIYSSTSRK